MSAERKCLCPKLCPTNGWEECPISSLQEENSTLKAELAALKLDNENEKRICDAAVAKMEQAENENERLRATMGICSGPCHGQAGEQYIVKVHEVVAELAALIPVAGACPECGIDPAELTALKAENEDYLVQVGLWEDKADRLKAELTLLKARSCETCWEYLYRQGEKRIAELEDDLTVANNRWVNIEGIAELEAELAQDRLEADAYAQTAEAELTRLQDEVERLSGKQQCDDCGRPMGTSHFTTAGGPLCKPCWEKRYPARAEEGDGDE
jgi:DNA repair exonuclease SbcCD ATPase subunit